MPQRAERSLSRADARRAHDEGSSAMSNDGALNDSDADAKNAYGTPGDDESADTASGGNPDTTDANDAPVDNPSGG